VQKVRAQLRSAADPELGNGGQKGGGHSHLPRKIFKILSKNDAFLCKIFTICKMHPVNKGGGHPPSFESATGYA